MSWTMSAIASPAVYSILAIQRLLPSTTQLIFLCLRNIPDTGYISRGDGCLSGLKLLFFGPPSPRPHIPPPPTCSILPVLIDFAFSGSQRVLRRHCSLQR